MSRYRWIIALSIFWTFGCNGIIGTNKDGLSSDGSAGPNLETLRSELNKRGIQFETVEPSLIVDESQAQKVLESFFKDEMFLLDKLSSLQAMFEIESEAANFDHPSLGEARYERCVRVELTEAENAVHRTLQIVGVSKEGEVIPRESVTFLDCAHLKVAMKKKSYRLPTDTFLHRQTEVAVDLFLNKEIAVDAEDVATLFGAVRFGETHELIRWTEAALQSSSGVLRGFADYFSNIDLVALVSELSPRSTIEFGIVGDQGDTTRVVDLSGQGVDSLQSLYKKDVSSEVNSVKSGFWQTNYGLYLLRRAGEKLLAYHHQGSSYMKGDVDEGGLLKGVWFNRSEDRTSDGGEIELQFDIENQSFEGSFSEKVSAWRWFGDAPEAAAVSGERLDRHM